MMVLNQRWTRLCLCAALLCDVEAWLSTSLRRQSSFSTALRSVPKEEALSSRREAIASLAFLTATTQVLPALADPLQTDRKSTSPTNDGTKVTPPKTSPSPNSVASTTNTKSTATASTVASSKPSTPSNKGGKLENPGNVKNCKDFKDYKEAKAWYDKYFDLYGDVAQLDGDGDGIPCESLPGAPPNKKKNK